MENPLESPSNGIAIIGMAGRFPGAGDVESFWANLVGGVETLSFFTPEELAAVGVEPELLSDPAFVRARAVIDGAELFDAAFFDISPREAEVIDPQQRLLLEHAWEALENAGHDPRRFPGAIGVYAGAGINTYLLSNLQKNPEAMGAVGSYQAMLGSGADFLATRVSFKLGLRGPSLTVQTACSTSLVAVHLAVQSLLAGECDMALAGGVRLLVPRKGGHLYQPGNIFSKDGHCRPFDAAAAGTTDGEGAGLVVLRRLEDALADGDRVYAVILGSAINNDGSSKMGYTVPSVEGQAEVIATAQALAGVDAGTIGLIEAHGTGTPLGDPIEVAALSRVFATAEEPGEPCALGSLKSNMGHLDAAAGIASLIKATLAVERGLIPPSLHFERPNPQIDFAATPFYVPVAATPWQPAGPRRAGVSSFGIGGTNAHLVLEEAPPAEPAEAEEVEEERRRLLVLSARTPAALEEMSGNLAAHLRRHPELALADVAHTLQVGRAELDHRRAVVVESLGDAAEVLASLDPKRVLTRSRPAGERQVFFLFPGQGSQHPGMAAALYRHEPVFRRELVRAAEILAPRLGLDLLQVIYPLADERAAAADRLKQTALAQPALFAVEHALARLWMSWGVRPAAMLGHSVGEYVAACLAGVFSLEDALALVAERGRLMQEMPGGAMLAVSLAEEEVRPLLGGLALAAVNGPSTCVVSGAAEEVEALAATLAGRGVEVRPLHTSHAFHSASMEPMLPRFAAAFEGVRLHPPAIPFVSNLTGTWIDPAAAVSPDYWVRHLRETVRFSAGLEALFARAGGVFLEVGPGRSLSSLARRHAGHPGASPVLASLPAAGDGEGEADAALLRALGQAWLAGVEIDWAAVDGGRRDRRGRRVALPTYPFERRRYWIEPASEGEPRRRPGVAGGAGVAGGKGIADWFWVPLWRQALPPAAAEAAEAAEDGAAGSWLLFDEPEGLGGRLAERLRERGREVVEVRPGERFAEAAGGGFTLRPGEAADYGALLDGLAGRGVRPARIVHLWSAGAPPAGGGGGVEGARQEMERGFWSLVHLARALGDRRPPGERPPLHLGIVASGVERITGAEELVPARATLFGPALNLPQEYPGITASVIDVDRPAPGSRREATLVDRLLAELEAGDAEPRVAYRGGERWFQVYEPLPLGGGAPPLPSRLPLREGTVCLITGGLGGVGLELAALLARLTRAKLVLTGRTPFPAREEWPRLSGSSGSSGSAARVARRLLEIEALGAEVLTVAADVTDAAAMRAALDEARRRFGRIEGVIHAAGLPGGGLMQWRSFGEMAAVLAPKVAGTLVLAELLAGDAPDFLVLCSSLNALAGGPGQADYTAANAFLDAFAQSSAGELPAVVSIDWDAWRDVGMAAHGEPEGAAPQVLDLQPFPHPFLGARGVAADGAAVFVARLHPRESWVLDEHRLGGQPVLPGTAYLEMVRAAFRGLAPEAGAIEIRGVQFLTPLRVGDGEARDCHVVLHASASFPGGAGFRFVVGSREGDDWQEHAAGEVGAAPAEIPGSAAALDIAALSGWDEEVIGEAYLEDLKQAGMGPRWEVLRKVYRREGEVVALLELAADYAGETEALEIHPSLLDVATGFAQEHVPRSPGYYLPLSYRRLLVSGPLPERVYSHARLHDAGSTARETLTFDITLFDPAGVERLRIDEFTIKRVDVAAALRGHPRREARPPAAPVGESPGMAPEEAAEAFRRILAGRHLPQMPQLPQVAVSVRPLPELLREARSVTVERLLGAARPEGSAGGGHARPDLDTPYVAPRGELEERLAAIWADVLGLDRVGVADDFFELGGHSLLGIQMVSRVHDALGVEVPLGEIFEATTVADFALLVAAQLARGGTSERDVIPRAPRDGELPLSYSQERLWFLEQLEPGSAFYSIPGAVRMVGPLHVAALAAALAELVGRHESLRTTFANRDGRPLQVVAPPPAAVPLPEIDLSALPAARREEELRRRVELEIRRPLDLARGPLLRVALLVLDGRDRVFTYTLHHIVSDGWSGKIFLYELATLYGAFAAGRPSPLPPVALQYADYAAWQRRTLSGEALAEQLAWWRERLTGTPALELPLDRPRPAVERFRGKNRLVLVPPEHVRGLVELTRGAGATLFMGLLAVLETLLLRLTGQTDLAVGSPIANRGRRELDSVIGFFANTLVLRTSLAGAPGFLELLGRVREVTLGAYAHEQLPFERLVEEVQPERDMSRNPLFSVMCVLQNQPYEAVPAGDLEITPFPIDPGTAKFDFMVIWSEEAAGLTGMIEHNVDLFDDTTIDRFYRHHEALLAAALADPRRPLLELPMLDEAERHQLLAEWNDTGTPRAGRPVHEGVGAQVRRRPDAVAAIFEGESLTYAALDAEANRLAQALRRRGVGPESLVGICAGRSLAMVVAALAVLKAGGGLVALDPAHPWERLSAIADDAGLSVLLCEAAMLDHFPRHREIAFVLDGSRRRLAGESAAEPTVAVESEHPMYAIYTSGSTGRPKGIVVPHRAFASFLEWQLAASPGAPVRTVQFAAFGFCVSFQEIFSAWCSGGTVVVAGEMTRRDLGALGGFLADHGIERLHLPYAALKQLAESVAGAAGAAGPSCLREVITAGEALRVTPAIRRLFAGLPGCTLSNQYGASETHVVAALTLAGSPEDWPALPAVGRAITGARIHLLDGRLGPVALGVRGEIFAGGASVPRCYLNDPALTAWKVVPDPFAAEPGARLYRTGDLGRRLADGRIESLGRADGQVKVRGFRVELGEVETVLAREAGVRDVAVVPVGAGEGLKLVAYLVPAPGAEEPELVESLRRALKRQVPEHMVPSAFVLLPELPVNANGKLDHDALPAPGESRSAAAYRAPETPVEEALAEIWQEVLGVGRVGLDDVFFELGGHSLLATQVMSRARGAFGLEVPLRLLFEAPTLAGLAERIEALRLEVGAVDAPPLAPVSRGGRGGRLPLSFAQERLWFLDRLAPGSAVYNMPLALSLVGTLDLPALAAAFGEIVRRHEALRTTFALPEGASEPVQVIGAPRPPQLPTVLPLVDLAGLGAAAEGEARRLAAADARQPFDLARGPLIRPLLLRTGAEEHVLLGTMHHTVSDGWSLGILVRELVALYPAFLAGRPSPLAALPVQYADYALWQRKWLSGAVLAGELAWWGEQLAGLPASLPLPTDRPRPAAQSLRGARRRVEIGPAVAAPFAALARGEGATLFMALFGAFAAMLARAAGETALAVGTPIAGRNRVEVEGLIGLFVNSLVLRADLGGDPSFRELLARARETTLAAYAHQDIPFERLVAELAPERSLSWSPLFQVMLVLQNAPLPALALPGLTLAPIEVDSGTTKLDLGLSLTEEGGGLGGSVEYSPDLFDETTVARLMEQLAALLEAAALPGAADAPLSTLTALAGPVRQQLLVEWNDTAAPSASGGQCLHELVEGWAARTPDAPAVLGEAPLSYADLDRLAEGLAGRLRRLGRLQPAESRVGVAASPSGLRIAALLAVHKAGGAYVPLDPELPPARLALLAADAGLAAVLVEGRSRERLAAALPGLPLVEIGELAAALETGEAGVEGHRGAGPDSLAYVVYTSGSTGTPNGVPVAHRSVVNLIDEARRELEVTPESRVLHLSSLSFDAAALEIFVALTSGAALVVGSAEETLPGPRLAEFLRRHAVTLAVTTPAVLALLPETDLPALRTVTVGGESCPPEVAGRWASRGRLVNCYGPTEATIYSTSWRCRPPLERVPPIGRPVANTEAFVLDPRLEPVPPGAPGELCLGGAGLARGYLGRPDLSARRFVPHPWPSIPGAPGARLYRTGDLVRHLPAAGGALEFLGRADAQVKVRGLRIEPGEIEAVLAGHPRVREALVAAVEEAGGARLVAFLVLAEAAPGGHREAGAEGDEAALALELRDRVAARLPAYMVPSQLVPLAALPLTPHGKVDRRALARFVPSAGGWGAAAEYVAPQTPLEEMLAEIWIELLGLERVGAHDSFFSLGGHSLQGIRLMSRIADEFGVELPVKALFEAPTLAALAERIGEEMTRLLGDEEEELLAVGEAGLG